MKSQSHWLIASDGQRPVDAISIPAGIQLLAGIRSDTQHLDLGKLTDQLALRIWWESGAHSEYPNIEWRLSPQEIQFLARLPEDHPVGRGGHGLSAAFKSSSPSILDALPDFALLSREFVIEKSAIRESLPMTLNFIRDDRPDLQASHDISNPQGRQSLLHWWFLHGQYEYHRLQWSLSPEWLDLVYLPDKEAIPLPYFLNELVISRSDLSAMFLLNTEIGRLKAIYWWEQHGCAEYATPSWSLIWHRDLRNILAQWAESYHAESESTRSAKKLPLMVYLAHQMRADLIAAFDIQTPKGCEQLQAWWNANGKSGYSMFSRLFTRPDGEVPGLNIVGYAQSVIGIAEDVRMAARSAELNDIPVCVVDAPMPGPAKVDHSLDHLLSTTPRHPISLYCLPPSEMFRLGMEGQTRTLDSGTYNIGGWHWELPFWPTSLASVTRSVHEIWVYTDFVRNAFTPLTTRPVLKMPLAVELPKHAGRNRSAFKLPKDPFLFLLMFDGNSWLTRKNPIAAVRAFRKAFPGNRHVGLVIKAISLNRASDGWKEVEAEIQGDERVKVIDQTLDRPALTQLMATCDAYVSLHRSEGFGRIIAEAMLLGIPTVTTNFSGNVEFCTPETSYLVNGPLINLKKGDYLFAEGQHWCDPDLTEATQQMQRLFEDRNHSKQLANAARLNIQTHFSASNAGAAYKARLLELRGTGRI